MLPIWYSEYKSLVDESINIYLSNYFSSEKNSWLDIIKDATFYAVRWWKRIRSILAIEFYLIFSWKSFSDLKNNDNILKFCVWIEFLHAYSLVHDDLPCIDNDIYRRGELTTWKKYSEVNGILVWDLLNSLAFEIISETNNAELINYFWKAVWLKWMLWGQVLDIFYEKNPDKLTLEKLLEVHNKKTWALIEVSVVWWILLSNLSDDTEKQEIDKYSQFWKKIWLAFQIKDDLLDVEWTFEETWKSVWWEDKWFVFFLWLEKTKLALDNELKDCRKLTSKVDSNKLSFLIDYIWTRKK